MNKIENAKLRRKGFTEWKLKGGVVYFYGKNENILHGAVLSFLVEEYLLYNYKLKIEAED